MVRLRESGWPVNEDGERVPRSISQGSSDREISIERDQKKIENRSIRHKIIDTEPELTRYISEVPTDRNIFNSRKKETNLP